jgi:hypothetical protein
MDHGHRDRQTAERHRRQEVIDERVALDEDPRQPLAAEAAQEQDMRRASGSSLVEAEPGDRWQNHPVAHRVAVGVGHDDLATSEGAAISTGG